MSFFVDFYDSQLVAIFETPRAAVLGGRRAVCVCVILQLFVCVYLLLFF